MSDSHGVRPKGVLTRPAADWFDDFLYVGGYTRRVYGPPPLSQAFVGVGLYNANSAGQVLKVYGINVIADGGGGEDAFFVHGTIGSLVGPALPLRPDGSIPNVQVYQDTSLVSAGAAPTYNYGAIYGTIGVSGFDGATVVSQFPLFIVPVGWSLVVANSTDAFNTGATFWFQVADG